MAISFEQEKAFRYYRKNSMSVEFLKDDYLQKVHFRVKNKVIHFYSAYFIIVETIITNYKEKRMSKSSMSHQ